MKTPSLLQNLSFTAEQRIAANPAQLWAQYTTPDGARLEVLVYMAPMDQLIVTNLSWIPGDYASYLLAILYAFIIVNVEAGMAESISFRSKRLHHCLDGLTFP